MTKEDKDLLLKDLCARLPYGVKCNVPYLKDIKALACIQYDAENTLFDFWDNNESYCRLQLFLSEFKPYLFPLSSMTEEQRNFLHKNPYGIYVQLFDNTLISASTEGFDWLNKNHFDYRGLIEKGLAIDATNLNIY